MKLEIKTRVDLAGDKWASNEAFLQKQKDEAFDPENPFGDLWQG